ncbi:hypothetical protein FHS57_000767 [Runella defluvii]|uniref:Uncharacterized protein n=1 Tax=Runella defluvii TaxID=370973 RepID=A0A7W5ZHN1_9BACT|nr:hypothetical protein [Runella defluvii]
MTLDMYLNGMIRYTPLGYIHPDTFVNLVKKMKKKGVYWLV